MFYLLGRSYNVMFHDLLEYPVTLIFMYYEWAVYDLEFDIYMRTATMSM